MKAVTMMTLCVAFLMTLLTGGLGSPVPAEGADEGGLFDTLYNIGTSIFGELDMGTAAGSLNDTQSQEVELAIEKQQQATDCVEVIEIDTDYTGSDLFEYTEDQTEVKGSNNKWANTPEQCNEICRDKEGCWAWTYVSSWAVKCLLKTDNQGKTEHKGMTSGNVCR